MPKIKDLVGETFGRLKVVEYVGQNKFRKSVWRCVCACGKELNADKCSLSTGNTRSCGCLHIDTISTHRSSGGVNSARISEYNSWQGMIQRCCNTKNPDYEKYGGRGITVCDRWKSSFELFILDMGHKPSPKHSIDRIDNSGDYTPENCRWADKNTQDRNKRNNNLLTYDGRTMCVTAWAEEISIPPTVLFSRINRLGWSIEKALTTPLRIRR